MKVIKDFQKAKETAINVMVITDDGSRNLLVPLELVSDLINSLSENGETPLLMADGKYIIAKGLVIGSNDFYRERRVILLGSELH